MAKYIRTLTVIYDTEISNREIPLFRGAVLKSLGNKANLLFHNHTGEETFRYSYPLIQYKRLNGKAAMVCVEEGAEIIGQFLSENSCPLMIGDREANFDVAHLQSEKTPIEISNEAISYHLHRWLPLNSENYKLYKDTESMVEKIGILERILTGNLLSFLKGMDIHIETQLDLNITDINKQNIITYKKVKMMAFDVSFKTNISLPQYIGLGKNASVGCGVVTRIIT